MGLLCEAVMNTVSEASDPEMWTALSFFIMVISAQE